MVYDVPRNYIGDSHWRDNDPVQDGDEFELDRGILIQVGEAVGRVDQDLTELLKRRKKVPDVLVPEKKSRPASLVTENTMNGGKAPATQVSQMLRPRPLNAVLGTPRGPIGRASLPTKSPHDQRMQRENDEWPTDRPRKRQRGDIGQSGKTSADSTSSTLKVSHSIDESRERGGVTANMVYPNSKPDPRRQCVHDVCTPTQSSRGRHVLERKDKSSSKERCSEVTVEMSTKIMFEKNAGFASKDAQIYGQPPSGEGSLELARSPSRQSSNLESTLISNESHQRAIEVLSDGETPDRSGETKGRFRLQMASRKPRRKLMYRDLLPQDFPKLSPNLKTLEASAMNKTLDEEGQKSARNQSTALSSLHQQEQARLEARLERQRAKRCSNKSFVETMREDSPGFRGSLAPKDNPECLHREHPKAKKKKIESCKVKCQMTRSRRSRSTSVEETASPFPKPSSTPHDTNIPLSKTDEMLFSGSLTTGPNPVDPPRPDSKRKDRSSSPIITTPLHKQSSQCEPPAANCSTQVPSSPRFQTQQILASTEDQAVETAEVLKPAPSQAIPSAGAGAKHCGVGVIVLHPDSVHDKVETASRPVESPIPSRIKKQLPGFKQPTRRSPLKKATSDTSSTRPPPLAPTSAPVAPAQTRSRSPQAMGMEHSADPWSKEAWDLLGCGRDGVGCGFREFVIKDLDEYRDVT